MCIAWKSTTIFKLIWMMEMTLDTLKIGEKAYITEINLKNTHMRPITLGLIEGTKVTCLSETDYSLLIEFFGQQMAISKHTAKKYGCRTLD
jgi:Fe2+ transport system protein FeoA